LANSPLPVKFEVETAGTLAKGIDKLAHGRFDVALFDLRRSKERSRRQERFPLWS
jgi:hypothetical protein